MVDESAVVDVGHAIEVIEVEDDHFPRVSLRPSLNLPLALRGSRKQTQENVNCVEIKSRLLSDDSNTTVLLSDGPTKTCGTVSVVKRPCSKNKVE